MGPQWTPPDGRGGWRALWDSAGQEPARPPRIPPCPIPDFWSGSCTFLILLLISFLIVLTLLLAAVLYIR